MIKTLLTKIKEALVAVIPITAIVFVLNLTPIIDFSAKEIVVFLISSFFLTVGIGFFNLGADLAMTPMGEHIGAGLTRTKKLGLLVGVSFLMGVLITVAEPDLTVLAGQVSDLIDPTLLTVTVGIGVGGFLVASVLKTVFRKQLTSMLIFFYMVLFALTSLALVNGKADFLALGFDSGGVTTGPITVPFIMALGVGIAVTLGGKNVGENSFGMIAMCSVGPILAVILLGIFSSGTVTYELPDYSLSSKLGGAIPKIMLGVAKEVLIAIGLILTFFIVLQKCLLRLPKRKVLQILIGILYTVVGLVVFLTAVNVGFMPIGYKLGTQLAERGRGFIIAAGFVLGAVTVLAEPAVHVLNKQVETTTNGMVGKRSMMAALSIGVGISIGLSMLRIALGFSILYYMIPGYFISIGLSFFVPGIYTAIAFDSGGVASGPLTSGFILPLAIGACCAMSGESRILTDAFGVVAMVAMTPLITIQFLGFRAIITRRVREKIAMKRILASDDEQIISFM